MGEKWKFKHKRYDAELFIGSGYARAALEHIVKNPDDWETV